jgi:hypothetical protein
VNPSGLEDAAYASSLQATDVEDVKFSNESKKTGFRK